MGIAVKMITGDHLAIARETARQLGLSTDIYTTGPPPRARRRQEQLGVPWCSRAWACLWCAPARA